MKLKKYNTQKMGEMKSKLASYSALTGAFLLGAGAAHGQVIYTDIDPDTLIHNSSFDVDLDHDGIKDFTITHSTSTYYAADRRVTLQAGADPTNQPMAGLANFMFFSLYAPLNLPPGNPIGPGGPFYSFGVAQGQMMLAKKWLQQGMGSAFYWTGRGPFYDSSGYIGLEFHSNGNTYYGWIECAIDSGVHGVVITGFSYDATPNMYVIAGNGNTSNVQEHASIISPASSFYPNPVSGGKTFILIDSGQPEDLRIEVINGMGQVLQSEDRKLNGGKNIVELDVNSLSGGSYFVKLSQGKNVCYRKILITR